MSQIDNELLEQWIDEHSLEEVLEQLGMICHEKAGHVQTNWQDTKLSRLWERAANKIFTAQKEAYESGL